MLTLARGARQAPWWRGYADVAPGSLLELIDYEHAATAISQFEPLLVPGILQTEEYARAVLQASYGAQSWVERLVSLRTRRRDLLTREGAPRFSFVLDEPVIRRPVGGPAAMRNQLMYLNTLAELPSVTIQVVPFAAGVHPGLRGPFKVIEFDDGLDESVVFIETMRGDIIGDDPAEAGSYLETFGRVTGLALGPAESVDLLRIVAGETV